MQGNEYVLVKEFHEKFNCLYHAVPALMDEDVLNLRLSLINEEVKELSDAITMYNISVENNNYTEMVLYLTEMLDAITDLLYVVYGFCVTFGLPIKQMFEHVHTSNLTKLDTDNKPVYNEYGKVLKGSNFVPPNFYMLATALLNDAVGANILKGEKQYDVETYEDAI